MRIGIPAFWRHLTRHLLRLVALLGAIATRGGHVFVVVAAVSAAAAAMGGDAAPLLRGKSFFVCPVRLGGMRLAIFQANIRKSGGLSVSAEQLGSGTDYFLVEKACEGALAHEEKVRQQWEQATGEKQLKSLHWLEDMLAAKRWIDEQHETPRHKISLELAGNTQRAAAPGQEQAGQRDAECLRSSKAARGSPGADEKRAAPDVVVIDDDAVPSKRRAVGRLSPADECSESAEVFFSSSAVGPVVSSSRSSQSAHPLGTLTLPAVAKYVPNINRPPPEPAGFGFENALLRIIDAPGKHEHVILMQDDTCLVLYDAYPKAVYHVLVLPKERVMSLNDLRREHLPLIKHMHRVALHVISSIRDSADTGGTCGAQMTFRIGYHCVPSLKLLHLHVISADFDSACLKNKKHWNSFQPPFFLDSQDVQGMLAEAGRVVVDKVRAEGWLKMPLTSHRTSETLKNIPALKEHLKQCKSPVSSGVVY